MPGERPSVSAIITAYNGADVLADAIESVLAQTRSPDEILVIDDGSKDNTAEVAKRFAQYGVRCVRQENRGASGARNRGILETTGDLIAFLDCDDLWLPEKTELQEKYLNANPEAGLVTSHVWWWNPVADKCWVARFETGRSPKAVVREAAVRNCVGNPSGVLIRRRVFDQVGLFNPKLAVCEDRDLWFRVATRFRFGLIDRPLMVYRVLPTSLTHQNPLERCERYYEFSRQAIRTIRPFFWQPILLSRAWSDRELSRAVCAQMEGRRSAYLLHGLLALISWPFENGGAKLKHLARALFGESLYRFYKRRRVLRSQSSSEQGIRKLIHRA